MTSLVFLAQAASTLGMFGVIWFVQIVHYPLFRRVGADGFAAYSAAHGNRTTIVVAPLMLVELATGVAFLFATVRPRSVRVQEAWLGCALLAAIWLSTALLQVPLHDRLRARYTDADARRLVATNWIRTAAWTLRAALVLFWISRLLITPAS